MKRLLYLKSIASIAFVCLSTTSFSQTFSKMTVTPVVKRKWTNFELSSVRLSDGNYFKDRFNQNANYLLSLDAERLTRNVLIAGGIATNAQAYGGWQAGGGNGFANYLAAISMTYAATGDTRFKDRVDQMIKWIDSVQRKENLGGYFYLNNNPGADPYNNLMTANNNVVLTATSGNNFYYWSGMAGNAFYQLHRVYAGIRDAYIYADNQLAKTVFIKCCDWVCLWTDKVSSDEALQIALNVEHGGIAEILTDAYAITGLDKYKKAADRWTHKNGFATELAANSNILPGKHANNEDAKMLGLIWNYEVTGKQSYGDAAHNVWNMIAGKHTIANGGHGNVEYYDKPGQILSSLGYASTEYCCTYNELKFTRNLFCLDGDEKEMDFYEKALYNHTLAAIDADNNDVSGGRSYYQGLRPGMFKTYMDQNANYCCWETSLEGHSLYTEDIYFRGDNGLLINLYLPSTLNWQEKGLKLTMTNRFPESDTITIHIDQNSSFTQNINLRIPAWVDKDSAKVLLNGALQSITATPGSNVSLQKSWAAGDEIKLILPLRVRVEATEQPNVVALYYGPVLLASDLGALPGLNDYITDVWGGTNAGYNGDPDFPVINAARKDINTWLKKKDGQFEFQTIGLAQSFTFKPYYSINHRRFSIYQKIADNAELAASRDTLTDEVLPNIAVSEQGHSMATTGANDVGFFRYTGFRKPNNGGTASYRMRVNNKPDVQHYVALMFQGWEEEATCGYFNVYVDGQKIATEGSIQHIEQNTWPQHFYKVPLNLTNGKDNVTVKIESTAGNKAPFFKLRMVTQAYVNANPMDSTITQTGSRYEAEYAQNKISIFSPQASEGAYANVITYLQFNNIKVNAAGDYTINIAYSALSNSDATLIVNNKDTVKFTYAKSGSYATDFQLYKQNVHLENGLNSIRIDKKTGTMSLDYIEVNKTLEDSTKFNNPKPDPSNVVARYEAEDAQVNHARLSTSSIASAGKYIGGIDYDDSYILFTVNAVKAGVYKMTVGYANGTTGDQSHLYSINGGTGITLIYPKTAGWGLFQTVTDRITLKAGTNTIKFSKIGYAELDYIELTPPQTSGRLEAEDAVVNRANKTRTSLIASAGGYVGNIDYADSYVQFAVSAPDTGLYKVKIGYASGSANNTMNLSVNGAAPVSVNFPQTSGWGLFDSVETYISLRAGDNTIRLTKGNNYVELDYIELNFMQPVAAPEFSIQGGSYNSIQHVILTCTTDGAVIHYTTDASMPDEKSPVYSSPIEVANRMVIKAFATKEGLMSSQIVSNVYAVDVAADFSSPLSIAPNPANSIARISWKGLISNDVPVTLIITDTKGNVVFKTQVQNADKYELNASQFASGTYVITAYAAKGKLYGKMLIVR